MIKKKLGNTGIEVTQVGFGVLTIGRNQLNLPLDQGAAILRYALEKGINFLDTAQYYRTYPFIKKALTGLCIDPVIVSKSLTQTYEGMKEAVEEARREIGRDVIDIFLLHEIRSDSDWLARKGAWEYLQEAKVKGIVKAVGASTHHVDVAEYIAAIPEADVLFPLINFRSLGIRKGSEQGTKEDMHDAIKKSYAAGKGIFAMKVFGGGILIGKYREALEYVMSLPEITSYMIGFGSTEEVDRIFDMMEGTLDKDYSPDLTNKRICIDQGDCEGCGACVDRCPNKAIYLNKTGQANISYDLCLTCGYCAPVCPVRAIIMIG